MKSNETYPLWVFFPSKATVLLSSSEGPQGLKSVSQAAPWCGMISSAALAYRAPVPVGSGQGFASRCAQQQALLHLCLPLFPLLLSRLPARGGLTQWLVGSPPKWAQGTNLGYNSLFPSSPPKFPCSASPYCFYSLARHRATLAELKTNSVG